MVKSRTATRTKKVTKAEKTKAKAVKPEANSKKAASADDAKEESNVTVASASKIVTIEHCKSWGAFKTRAAKIQVGVGKAAKVVVNEEKPRKGAFVVTVSGVKDPIVELLDLKRPFAPLKALDMDEVVKNVLNHL